MNNPFRRESEDPQSFLPEDYVQSKSETRTNLIAVFLFAAVMFGVVSAFLVTSRRWEAVRDEKARIESEYQEAALRIEQLKALETQRSEMVDKAELTTALIERVPRSVLLAEIVTRLPAGATLNVLELKSKRIKRAAAPTPTAPSVRSLTGASSGDNPQQPAKPKVLPPRFEYTITLVGVAEKNNQIADYLRSLQSCPLLDTVELEFIRNTIEEDVAFRSFRIVATLREDADVTQLASDGTADSAEEPASEGDSIDALLGEGDSIDELTTGEDDGAEFVEVPVPAGDGGN